MEEDKRLEEKINLILENKQKDFPKQMSWYDIKNKYYSIIAESKEINDNVNYTVNLNQ